MLRREKKEVFGAGGAAGAAPAGGAEGAAGGAAPGLAAPGSLGHKNDLVVWLRLQPNQRALYEAFLNSDSVKAVLNQTSSALAALTVLKKVCDHPALLSERAQQGIISGARRAARRGLGGGGGSGSSEEEAEYDSEGDGGSDSEGWVSSGSDDAGAACRRAAAAAEKERRRRERRAEAQRRDEEVVAAESAAAAAAAAAASPSSAAWAGTGVDGEALAGLHTAGFEASCKTVFVMGLLRDLVAGGHRTLVFSQSRVMLDILQAAVAAQRWPFRRIDGSVASASERQARVEDFQGDASIPIFLLTSQVGGLGLTLTAADRVM